MKCIALTIIPALLGLSLIGSSAFAQTAKDLVGTWEAVSIVNTGKDGTKTEPFGANPKSILVFGADGRFALIEARSDFPTVSDNILQWTPDENKTILQGSLALFGNYSVADNVLIQHPLGGTRPSWVGTDLKRTISSYTKDHMVWTLSAPTGGTNEAIWKRLN